MYFNVKCDKLGNDNEKEKVQGQRIPADADVQGVIRV